MLVTYPFHSMVPGFGLALQDSRLNHRLALRVGHAWLNVVGGVRIVILFLSLSTQPK